jgi:hypothetical protein
MNSRLQVHRPILTKAFASDRKFVRVTPLLSALFVVGLTIAAGFALGRYHGNMNYYDKLVLLCSVPVFAILGVRWRRIQILMVSVGALSLTAIHLYGGHLSRADNAFFLKYLLSSQTYPSA